MDAEEVGGVRITEGDIGSVADPKGPDTVKTRCASGELGWT